MAGRKRSHHRTQSSPCFILALIVATWFACASDRLLGIIGTDASHFIDAVQQSREYGELPVAIAQ